MYLTVAVEILEFDEASGDMVPLLRTSTQKSEHLWNLKLTGSWLWGAALGACRRQKPRGLMGPSVLSPHLPSRCRQTDLSNKKKTQNSAHPEGRTRRTYRSLDLGREG